MKYLKKFEKYYNENSKVDDIINFIKKDGDLEGMDIVVKLSPDEEILVKDVYYDDDDFSDFYKQVDVYYFEKNQDADRYYDNGEIAPVADLHDDIINAIHKYIIDMIEPLNI